MDDGVELDCFPACQDVAYRAAITSSAYPNQNLMDRDARFFCLVFRKIRAICYDKYRRFALEERYPKEAL